MFIGDVKTIYLNHTEDLIIYQGLELIYPVGLTPGTTFDFNYTGGVLSIELPKGKYKLLCWGAQGGTSYATSSAAGSKGGYSEGVLTLTKKTILYIFVGGQGSRGSSTSLVNGGWNGGGASVGYTSYNSGGTNGYSYPACGGGATDISTVNSDMSYSGGRTNRSAASLLARCIVAGGGAGGSYRYTKKTSSSTTETNLGSWSLRSVAKDHANDVYYYNGSYFYVSSGDKVYFSGSYPNTSTKMTYIKFEGSSTNQYKYTGGTVTVPSGTTHGFIFVAEIGGNGGDAGISGDVYKITTTTSTSNSSGYSNQSQQGGGTSGRGSYPGTQSAGGSGSQAGGFGYGANQPTTGNRYDSGAGGGGWYGGGSYTSDSSTSAVNYSGGGSGFVNTAANASYRPSGYTGLQLDSGTTTAGNTSHPSVSGGTEIGHSGNGYARIIALDKNGEYPIPEPTYSINWATQTGTWNDSSNSSSATGYSYTCVSPGTGGSTVLRCTFSGISSITFYVITSGESCCDYLTIGDLDSSCTRSSYKSKVLNSSGSCTYEISDLGEHYIEFCYSKDGSVDSGTDNATVYIQSYS